MRISEVAACIQELTDTYALPKSAMVDHIMLSTNDEGQPCLVVGCIVGEDVFGYEFTSDDVRTTQGQATTHRQ